MAFPTTPILDNFLRTQNPLTSPQWNPTSYVGTGSRSLQCATGTVQSATTDGTTAGQNFAFPYALPVEVYASCTNGLPSSNHNVVVSWLTNVTQGAFNGYTVAITNPGPPVWSIIRRDAGVATPLNSASSGVSFTANTQYGMSISASGLITAYQNGVVLGTAVDTTYKGTGFFAISTTSNTAAFTFGGGKTQDVGDFPLATNLANRVS